MLSCALVLLIVNARRANELFRISVHDGQPRLERGRLPPALFDDIRDVVQRERLAQGVIRGVLEAGSPRLLLSADASSAAQPLRNVLGRYSAGQLRAGRMRPGGQS